MLVVSGLTKRFGGVAAVDDLSFSLDAGEVLAVVGPNGAGKSTLLQLITGLVRPDAGSIRLDGVELVGRSPDQIAALGVARTFQTSRVFPGLSVWDSVRVGLHPALLRGRSGRRLMSPLTELLHALWGPRSFRERERDLDRRAEEAMRRFGQRLWGRRFDRADSLSYANRRRLEMARAIASHPRLLLLDEPTAGMNPTETAEFAEVLDQLHRTWPHMAVLVVEHKLPFVRQVARRVLVMNQGRRLAEGPPEAVMEDPRVVEAYLGGRAARAGAVSSGHG